MFLLVPEVRYVSCATLRCPLILDGKKVLLIAQRQSTWQVRATVLRDHGVEVDEAAEMSAARFLSRVNVYDLIMIDVRRYPPGEILEFYEQIKGVRPEQYFAFLLGPPKYVSVKWPEEITEQDASRNGQWGETVKRFWTAA